MNATNAPARTFDARQHLTGLLRAALASVAPDQGHAEIILERPKQASHGDFASNLAMQLARELKTNPRQIAERLVRELPPSSHVVKAEVAGAGFINFTLTPAARTAVVAAVLAAGPGFGTPGFGAPRGFGQAAFGAAPRPLGFPAPAAGFGQQPAAAAEASSSSMRSRLSSNSSAAIASATCSSQQGGV